VYHVFTLETTMTFEKLAEANRLRLSHFKNRQGLPAHSTPDGSDWTIAEWTNAMAGECGEACNLSKKIRRGDYSAKELQEAINKLMDELADVVIYADHCASQLGRSLGDIIVDKFNSKSEEVGSSVRVGHSA
jgi:NTP pyrophosphatase (non-canonical NTP hydrolase)